ncbi:MAG: hypothetical protein ABIL58_20595 [Pseudomonadota bacterium]
MKTRALVITAILLAAMTATAWAGEVSQGRFISASQSPAKFTLEEYDTNFSKDHPYGVPTGIVSQYDVSKAKVGITPQAGDILRIAYEEKGDVKRAVKVMNVSKQDLRKK